MALLQNLLDQLHVQISMSSLAAYAHGPVTEGNLAEHAIYDAAEQKAEATPIKVSVPAELNRKAFTESPGGLISPGDNSTVYEPDRCSTCSAGRACATARSSCL